MIKFVQNDFMSGNKFWNDIRQQISSCINNSQIEDFYTWYPIRFTMLVENAAYTQLEIQYLLSVDAPPLWLDEPLPLQSNCIHHLYHIYQWLEKTGHSITNLSSILEFGAGYGSTCKLFHKLGFDGTYTIFDFPELVTIQKHYLSFPDEGFVGSFNIVQLDSQAIDNWAPDLFVAEWSLSEAGQEERELVKNNLKSNKHLIAYSRNFEDNKNEKYFDELTTNYLKHKFEIPHLREHFYLFT